MRAKDSCRRSNELFVLARQLQGADKFHKGTVVFESVVFICEGITRNARTKINPASKALPYQGRKETGMSSSLCQRSKLEGKSLFVEDRETV